MTSVDHLHQRAAPALLVTMATLTWGLTQKQANEAEEGRKDVEDAGHLKMCRWQKTDIFKPWKLFAVNDGVKGRKRDEIAFIKMSQSWFIQFCTHLRLRRHCGSQRAVSSIPSQAINLFLGMCLVIFHGIHLIQK